MTNNKLMSPRALAIAWYMLLRFSVVSGHLLFVHFQIQLASPKCTQITFTTKVKVCLVILVHDLLGIVRDGGYDNSCKKRRVICVLCAFVSLSFHCSFCWFYLNPKSDSWFGQYLFQETDSNSASTAS